MFDPNNDQTTLTLTLTQPVRIYRAQTWYNYRGTALRRTVRSKGAAEREIPTASIRNVCHLRCDGRKTRSAYSSIVEYHADGNASCLPDRLKMQVVMELAKIVSAIAGFDLGHDIAKLSDECVEVEPSRFDLGPFRVRAVHPHHRLEALPAFSPGERVNAGEDGRIPQYFG